mmetsp:Transcript_7472/g.17914  ORF Transcript_7472/g.17914 Transcript_7472/m.17914 type:complete len:422 (+) Transcript_7472:457-1722(+)
MRRATFYLFIAISMFSLACGFYDLYKNVPYLRSTLSRLVGRMYLPVFQWLEEHTKIRLSIFLTYLFGKSPLFVTLLQLASRVARSAAALLAPLADCVGRPLLRCWRAGASSVGAACSTLAAPAVAAARALGPPAAEAAKALLGALSALLKMLAKGLEPLAVGLAAVVAEPLNLLAQAIRCCVILVQAVFAFLRRGFSLVIALWYEWLPTLRRSASFATRATRATKPLSINSRAWNGSYWKTITLKIVYALKSIVNVLVYVACSVERHRKSMLLALTWRLNSLELKARRAIRPCFERQAEAFRAYAGVWHSLSGLLFPRDESMASRVSADSLTRAAGNVSFSNMVEDRASCEYNDLSSVQLTQKTHSGHASMRRRVLMNVCDGSDSDSVSRASCEPLATTCNIENSKTLRRSWSDSYVRGLL